MAAPKGNNNNPNGRGKGVPNKATSLAREAIAKFVDDNAERLQEWLDRIADDRISEDGKVASLGNPIKAFELFQSVIEYHIPKLSRTEQKVEGKLNHTFGWAKDE